MNILIIGGGTVGLLLIEKLKEKSKITVVERDMHQCEKIAEKYENVEVVNSKAEDTDSLESLKIDKYDMVFVVTGNQSANIVASLYLKHINAKRIICKLSTPNYIEMLNDMGIETVCEDVVTADELIRKAFSPDFLRFISSGVKLEKINNEFSGLAVVDVLQKGVYPLVMVRKGVIHIPRLDEIIEPEDELFLLKQQIRQGP